MSDDNVLDENSLHLAPNEPGRRTLFWSPLNRLWRRITRKLPRLVWPDDELDVVVTFSQERLVEGSSPDDAMRQFFDSRLVEVERGLREMGVSFDTGMGFGGRDWEWDFSLRGPISVRFKRRAKYPERRKARPKPQLVHSK